MLRRARHRGLHRRGHCRRSENRVGASGIDDLGDPKLVVIILTLVGRLIWRRRRPQRQRLAGEAAHREQSSGPLEKISACSNSIHNAPLVLMQYYTLSEMLCRDIAKSVFPWR